MDKRKETDLEPGGGLIKLRYLLESIILVLSILLPAIIPHPIRLTVKARKGNILGTLSPFIIKSLMIVMFMQTVAYAALIIIMTLAFTICLSMPLPS